MDHAESCSCYPCRGRKAHRAKKLHESQAAVAARTSVYSNADKQRVRHPILRAVEKLGGPYLTLWGGGEDARQVRDAFPDVEVVAAENNKSFFLALADDAQRCQYRPHAGNVTRVEGLFRVINLDTCSGIDQAGGLAAQIVPKLADDGLMFVTVMGTDRHSRWIAREAAYASALTAITGLRVVAVLRYRTLTGLPAYVIVLSKHVQGIAGLLRVDLIHGDCQRRGWFVQNDFAWLHGLKSRARVCRHCGEAYVGKYQGGSQAHARTERHRTAMAGKWKPAWTPRGACTVCGALRPKGRRTFCSEECRRQVPHRRRQTTITATCSVCGTDYPRSSLTRPSRGDRDMCRSCRARHGQPPRRPDCHPDNEYAGKGLCVRCSKGAAARRWRLRQRLASLQQAA